MKKPYFIIEVANAHGGDFEYLQELIGNFSKYREGYGIKFQAFHPDKIAMSTYSAYDIYHKLHFGKKQWQTAISKAAETKDIWLDIFDIYGVSILKENFDDVYGIKFQSSVLYNYEVFAALSEIDLGEKRIILNVAAHPVEAIREILEYLENKLAPEEILLEFGYQAYPTSIEDSGLSKLTVIKDNFSNRIVFADHVDGKSDDAIWLPVVMASHGIDVFEKHVMLSSKDTQYDHFSSLTPDLFDKMVNKVLEYSELINKPFINPKEIEYLNKSVMIPVLTHDKAEGSLIDIKNDFIYRRSGQSGLSIKEIKQLVGEFKILANDKKAGDTLLIDDFRPAKIATIIACRMKSSRLPKKALLKIGNLTSVERCIRSCLEFKNIDYTILATSTLPEDSILKDYTYSDTVIFHQGDPDDVIRRYLEIADFLNIDIILRVTADNPFVPAEIAKLSLETHFTNGSEYTTPRKFAVGTGIEIMNTTSLHKIKEYFPKASYSEYMTWYFQNNPEHFRLNFFDLPDELIRDYRLTLDYSEDLEMFNVLQNYFDENKLSFNIQVAFDFLDKHEEIVKINDKYKPKYTTDSDLIETLNKKTKIL